MPHPTPLRLPPLTALRAFEAAARHLSFKRAAQELSVTPTAISHRIRVLEDWLGKSLFRRKVRAVALTADGKRLAVAVSEGFSRIMAGVDGLQRTTYRRVTISTTPAFAAQWLVPRLADFQSRHPDIELALHADDRPVDLQAGEADLAIRYGRGPWPGTTDTILLQDRFAAVASPALLSRVGADPQHWPLIHFNWHQPIGTGLTWPAWAERAFGSSGQDAARDWHAGAHYSEESHAIQAAIAGQGVALLGLSLIDEPIRQGRLQIASPVILAGLPWHLLQPQRPLLSEAARKVAAWLVDAAGDQMEA